MCVFTLWRETIVSCHSVNVCEMCMVTSRNPPCACGLPFSLACMLMELTVTGNGSELVVKRRDGLHGFHFDFAESAPFFSLPYVNKKVEEHIIDSCERFYNGVCQARQAVIDQLREELDNGPNLTVQTRQGQAHAIYNKANKAEVTLRAVIRVGEAHATMLRNISNGLSPSSCRTGRARTRRISSRFPPRAPRAMPSRLRLLLPCKSSTREQRQEEGVSDPSCACACLWTRPDQTRPVLHLLHASLLLFVGEHKHPRCVRVLNFQGVHQQTQSPEEATAA